MKKIYSNSKYYNIQPRSIFVSRYNPEPVREIKSSFVDIPILSPSKEYLMMKPVPVYYEHEVNPSPVQSNLSLSPINFKVF